MQAHVVGITESIASHQHTSERASMYGSANSPKGDIEALLEASGIDDDSRTGFGRRLVNLRAPRPPKIGGKTVGGTGPGGAGHGAGSGGTGQGGTGLAAPDMVAGTKGEDP